MSIFYDDVKPLNYKYHFLEFFITPCVLYLYISKTTEVGEKRTSGMVEMFLSTWNFLEGVS